MQRRPKPFFRKQNRCWYVEIDGKQIRLYGNELQSHIKYAEIMSVTAPCDVQTYAELHFRFLRWVGRNRSARTHEWYAFYLPKALPVLAMLNAADVKPYHLTAVLENADLSTGGLHNLARAVQSLMTWAENQRFVERNPLAKFEKPPQMSRDECVDRLTYERIMAAVRDLRFRRFLEFAWETGARPQEMTRLEVRHFDPEFRRLVLPHKEAKGKRQARLIYLTERAMEIAVEAISGRTEGVIFLNRDGKPWTKNSVCSIFYRLRKKGIDCHMGAFRKGFITEAIKNGVDTVTLSHLVGHASTDMISKIYAKLQHDPEHMRQSAARAKRGSGD